MSTEQLTYVVVVQRTELSKDVYGPYKGAQAFKDATGDAIAWGGTVEPIQPPSEHTFKGVHSP